MVDRIRARGVILDLDDTLFDHQASARRGVARLVEELGAAPTRALVDAWETTAHELMARRRAGELDRAEYRRERIRHLLADLPSPDRQRPGDSPRPGDPLALRASECDELYERFLALYEQEWRPFDDALPTLRALAGRRVPVAVLTNGPERRQQKKMRELGLRDLVVGVWTSQRIGAAKPDPASYLAVCDALGLEPEDVLHVGDNREHDVVGARAAGLPALHLDRAAEREIGDERIRGLSEVPSRLRRGAMGSVR